MEIFKGDPDKVFIINYAPIFANLNFLAKNLIMQKSKIVEYKKGDTIYKQFDPADAFYCVISGRIRIASGKEKSQTLEYLNCGKYFGIISLLTAEPHSVNAEAANDSKILKINREDFQEILEKVPQLAIDLSKTLSRRLRRRDIAEKRVFESSIISIFSFISRYSQLIYTTNFVLSLKKETGKNIALVNVSREIQELSLALDLGVNRLDPLRVKMDKFSSLDESIKEVMLKDPVSGISILNIKHDEIDRVLPSHLNALLTHLTGDFHFIIVALPQQVDELVFSALAQSDSLHIIVDDDYNNLTKTKSLLSELYLKVNYPQEKIRILINTRHESRYQPYEGLLNYKIYARLPMPEEDSKQAFRIVIEKPHTEYAKALRRISREVGDVRVGLALSGGSALGLAHIGVIKVLERENIPIDMLVGTSMGAVIGALWAIGLDSKGLEKIALEFNRKKKKVLFLLMDFGFPKLSFAKGRRIKSFLKRYLGNRTFQDLKFPLKIVACNLDKREKLIFESGRLLDAVVASSAIPGIFAPAKVNGDLVIDGGIVEPVSVGTLVKLGIKKIIAANVLPSPENIAQSYKFNLRRKGIFSPNILDIIINSIQTMEYIISENECQRADIVLRPQVLSVNWFELYKAEKIIEIGEKETISSLVAIKNLLSQ